MKRHQRFKLHRVESTGDLPDFTTKPRQSPTYNICTTPFSVKGPFSLPRWDLGIPVSPNPWPLPSSPVVSPVSTSPVPYPGPSYSDRVLCVGCLGVSIGVLCLLYPIGSSVLVSGSQCRCPFSLPTPVVGLDSPGTCRWSRCIYNHYSRVPDTWSGSARS